MMKMPRVSNAGSGILKLVVTGFNVKPTVVSGPIHCAQENLQLTYTLCVRTVNRPSKQLIGAKAGYTRD